MDRRDFLRSSLAAGAAASLWTGLPAQAQASGSPKSPQDPQGINKAVVLMGDDVPHYGRDQVAHLDDILARKDKFRDSYLRHGAVEELEARFAALLGKQDAAFMPTGTLANQVAIRLLCGEKRRAIVQQESHVYMDESDAVSTLSDINLLPIAPGKATPTMAEFDAALKVSDDAVYPMPVGAISIESPVRRADGAFVPLDVIQGVAERAKAKGIGMHLDGARLLLNSGAPGFDVKSYSAPFDTVYVSLYKYLGAPFGAILAGSKEMIEKARATRHIFGGTIAQGWMSAAFALDALDGFQDRFARVRAAGDALLDGLARLDGYTVQRVPHGTNIHFLQVSEARQAGLQERLKKSGVMVGGLRDNRLMLTFNESLLRKPTPEVVRAFAG
ncbi:MULTISPECIES: threonine aldolase family protein [Dyella]|uniref:Amino acid lyase n=2 Tax=Dyella TaxID=231454 RepID=A0A4R0YWC2_9GAMM|nr:MULTISPECIES: beta-eliminating lyase-related protein [Dyella]TBR40263.1 amino acid lyase [Dyella terrae]TCI13763.1 amino acid lyase [Dyella soli]